MVIYGYHTSSILVRCVSTLTFMCYESAAIVRYWCYIGAVLVFYWYCRSAMQAPFLYFTGAILVL